MGQVKQVEVMTVKTSPRTVFQECTGSWHANVPVPKLQSTDGLTVLARTEIVAILVHYQPSYNTSHTMKPSDPVLLGDVALCCGIYPAGKVDISQHLATPGFPQSDLMRMLVHHVVKHSRPPDLKSSSNVSLPLAWITGPGKRTQLAGK